MDSRSKDFNKEIIIGEAGALAGASLFGILSIYLESTPNLVSVFTILGSVIGGLYSWVITRIYDQKRRHEFSIGKLGKDLSWYSPIALLTGLFICYPIIFFVTRSISLKSIHLVSFGPIIGELAGFTAFIIIMNSYRYFLKAFFKKIL